MRVRRSLGHAAAAPLGLNCWIIWRLQLGTGVFRLGGKQCLVFRKLKKKKGRNLVNCCLFILNKLICVLRALGGFFSPLYFLFFHEGAHVRFQLCGCNVLLAQPGMLGWPCRDAKASEVQILLGLWQGKLLSQPVPCIGERKQHWMPAEHSLLPLPPGSFLKVTGEIRGGDENRLAAHDLEALGEKASPCQPWHPPLWRINLVKADFGM